MKKRRVLVRLVALAIVVSALASTHALAFWNVRARGDYQILRNNPAVVRAWVVNTGSFGQAALVTVVGVSNAVGGPTYVQGAYPVYVFPKSAQPVDVSIGAGITVVSRIIVTPLGSTRH